MAAARYVECREARHGHCMETVIHFSSSFVNSFQILTKYSKKHQQIEILHYKLDSKLAFNWIKSAVMMKDILKGF